MGAVNRAAPPEADSIPAVTKERSVVPVLLPVSGPPPFSELPIPEPGPAPLSVQRQPQRGQSSLAPKESRTSYDRTSVVHRFSE
jgi:hypothetical protein